MAETAYAAFEAIPGALDAGAIIVCDHASNAIPPDYGTLGLKREALERHIAYDIGAAEIARRSAQFWEPYRQEIAATVDAMIAAGEPPAVISIHSFTAVWRGFLRPWKVGILWDRDDRMLKPLVQGLLAEPDLFADDVGDNEPYDGALAGDTIDAIATSRGLANALIEIRQDLITEKKHAEAWAERIARILRPALADRRSRAPADFGSRARGSVHGGGKPSATT